MSTFETGLLVFLLGLVGTVLCIKGIYVAVSVIKVFSTREVVMEVVADPKVGDWRDDREYSIEGELLDPPFSNYKTHSWRDEKFNWMTGPVEVNK